MFDIGFWEIAIIGVIALLVVGPERLPGLARNVGLWVGRIRRYVSHVKRDIERELHAEEVRQLVQNPEGLGELKEIAKETASVVEETRKSLHAAEEEAGREESPAADAAGQTPASETALAGESLSRVSPSPESGAPQEGSPAAGTPAGSAPAQEPVAADIQTGGEPAGSDHEQRPGSTGQP